jgi:hypothetical protein
MRPGAEVAEDLKIANRLSGHNRGCQRLSEKGTGPLNSHRK